MIVSEDRQVHFAHLMIDGLWGDEIIDFDEDNENVVVREAKRLIADWVLEQGNVDASVRETINKLKRNVIEGTPEWKILYNKYYAAELSRRGHR